ncbi:Metallophosphoesterase domain-containing protein 1 [Trichoderma lentiforme]|uniref:Metallophosphoesterase domain-containing protein 1 n=1 Tax=Trichoderma lentiforme TaxID=1567552 RepID=A0A9P4XJH4_9HYPO|nr:Metallophosphoesterase domain-containing protein 1 [Trichoderma lentiforme]
MPIPPLSPPSSPSSATIKTRILIISDTHSSVPQTKEDNPINTEDELETPRGKLYAPSGFRTPLPEADVVLHCGDLTKRGQPEEIRKTFSMLRKLSAPLKLVIAGNHDLMLDRMFYEERYGGEELEYDEVNRIIKEAEADGVKYLTEGTYDLDLANGSRLRIFASPNTPAYGYWAFQYEAGEHNFDIPADVDIAMTHGPPLGILDQTRVNNNAGCGNLFRSIHRAKPKIHCFGHIHEAWGAHLIRWKADADIPGVKEEDAQQQQTAGSQPIISPATAADWENSRLIYTLTPPPISIPTNDSVVGREDQNLLELSKDRGCYLDLTEGENMLKQGEETLFVNASIMSIRYRPSQMPWVIDIDLPRTTA